MTDARNLERLVELVRIVEQTEPMDTLVIALCTSLVSAVYGNDTGEAVRHVVDWPGWHDEREISNQSTAELLEYLGIRLAMNVVEADMERHGYVD